MDVNKHNSKAWDYSVDSGNIWTQPVSKEIIEKVKREEWEIFLSPTKRVPKSWFPDLSNLKVLCLASGGGQQGPILAAAGAEVTVLDNSLKQLKQDEYVANRENLEIKTVKQNMSDLSIFKDNSFDLIINPISNLYVEDTLPVWREAYRVLNDKGILITGFVNPLIYLFDQDLEEKGILKVVNSLPYSDLESLDSSKIKKYKEENIPFEYGHTLEDQIKGQIDAGFVITGFYEDNFGGEKLYDEYFQSFIVTKAVKTNV